VVSLIGKQLHGLEITHCLSAGEAEEVFLASSATSAERRIIKFVAPSSIEFEVLKHLQGTMVADLIAKGEYEQREYLLLEYYSGGDLLARAQRGMKLSTFLGVIASVARTLDQLHASGFLHGDLRPEHVVFNKEHVPHLIDFSAAMKFQPDSAEASASDGSVQNTVQASPAYISPERAKGLVGDGRTDIYSLGVMVFQLLAGRLPYADSDASAVIAAHLQDPIPRLPNHFATFQQLIDGLMAKQPDNRFASGNEIIQALTRIEFDDTQMGRVIKTAAIDTRDILSLEAHRTISRRDLRKTERKRRHKRRRRIALQSTGMLLVASLVFAGFSYFREDLLPIFESVGTQLGIIENPALTRAISDAESLRQDPNQGLGTVIAAYQRALALAPDYAPAQLAMTQVRDEWLASIEDALAKENLQLAQTRLDEAQQVFDGAADLMLISLRLQNRFRAERLLQSTQLLLDSHGLSDLPSATAAIQGYQEILRIAPNHAEAELGLDELARHYAGMASEAAEKGEVKTAITLLERASAARRELRELDNVRKLITQAETIQSAIQELLSGARLLRADNNLIEPVGNNAAELYQQVLATDPDNPVAIQGLDEINAQIMSVGRQSLDDGDLPGAEEILGKAIAAGLKSASINNLRTRIDAEKARRADVVATLSQAEEFVRQGLLTAPTETNAVAMLRKVQQLDPGNGRALELLNQIAQRLAAVAEEAYAARLRSEAVEYLDLALTVRPDVEEWVTLRGRWSQTNDS
tara:strand:+ start:429 stop:2690 length:2262 start_codon:yes stop_codon:yes gene_type:complete